MLACIALVLACVSSTSAAIVATSPTAPIRDATITSAPQIELLKRQNNANYMGWTTNRNGGWETQSCNSGATYFPYSGQWACCSTTSAGCLNDMPTQCFNGNMIYAPATTGTLTNLARTFACTSLYPNAADRTSSVCNTYFMYENEQDSNPKSNLLCGVSPLNWTYYRQRPAAATSAASSAAASAAASSRAASIAGIPVPTPASSTSTPTGGSTPSSSPPAGEEKSESKAWIAGAVVGPLVGLALIGFGIFFFMRRKKNRNTSRNVAPASGSIPAPGVSAYQQNAYPTNPGSPAQPQYYDHPNMSQTGAAAPYDPHKQSAYYPHGPQSPNSQGSHSPYGTAPQPWQQGVQPVYEAPSSAMSPQLQSAQLAQYQHNAPQHFSNELEGSNPHGQPGMTNVREMR